MSRLLLYLVFIAFQIESSYAADLQERTYLRVTVTMSDTEGDRLVSGLKKEDFEVLDRGTPQSIDYFSATPSPSSVTILLDLNGSMQSIDLSSSLENLIEFSNARSIPDEVCLIAFADRSEVVKSFAWQIRNVNFGEMCNLLTERDESSDSGITEAFKLANERILFKSSNFNRGLILITDGEEDLSFSAMRQIRDQAEILGLRIYGIFFPGENRLDVGRLHHLTTMTGGKYFRISDPSRLELLLGWILHELRYEYIVGFSSNPISQDEEERKLSVTITNPRIMPGTEVRFTTTGAIGRIRKTAVGR